jgi:broad specificity phosphatase PhoE
LRDALEYKDVNPLPKEESETDPTVYIFRHGQTEDNANYIFSGWRDSPLTEKGEKQAKILAGKLKNKKIDVLIASPQTRAIDTMKIAISLNKQAKE